MKPSDVINHISATLDVSVEALQGKTRNRDIADKRHIAMYLIRKYCKFPRNGVMEPLPYEQIGYAFNKDHCTIIHAVRKIEYLMMADDNIFGMVSVAEKHIARITKTIEIVNKDNDFCPHCGQVVKEN